MLTVGGNFLTTLRESINMRKFVLPLALAAASASLSAPAIAHMWHMPGHTYSALKRYGDAAWQQEASARVDHAYMMTARILPDQIFNFAHNNQWLCTDLLYCGRVRDAIALAKNMVELPRHPKYNTLNRKEDNTAYEKNNGTSMLGRSRLLVSWTDRWSGLIAAAILRARRRRQGARLRRAAKRFHPLTAAA